MSYPNRSELDRPRQNQHLPETRSREAEKLTDLERILIGNSPQIAAVRDMVFDFSASKASALILGETGSGKELVARALHDLGETPSNN